MEWKFEMVTRDRDAKEGGRRDLSEVDLFLPGYPNNIEEGARLPPVPFSVQTLLLLPVPPTMALQPLVLS